MPLLFSYGTLQQKGVQRRTFGRLLAGAADALPGFRKNMLRITDPDVIAASGADHHPIVVPTGNKADEIAGTVFEISDEELAAADAYEVDDYERILVTLRSGKTAWVYVDKTAARQP